MLSRFVSQVCRQVPTRAVASQASSNILFPTFGRAPNVVIDNDTKAHILNFNREFRENPAPITPGDTGVIFDSEHYVNYLSKRPEAKVLLSSLKTLREEQAELFWRRFARTAWACDWSDKQRFEAILVIGKNSQGLDLIQVAGALYQNPHRIDIKGLEGLFEDYKERFKIKCEYSLGIDKSR